MAKITIVPNEKGAKTFSYVSDILPRLGDMVLVEDDPELYMEDDPISSLQKVTQITHTIKDNKLLSIDVFIESI